MQFDHWDEELTEFAESDLELAMQDHDWQTADEDAASEDELEAPTAEQIQALISQIAESSETPAESPETPAESSEMLAESPESEATPEPVTNPEPSAPVTIDSLDDELREAFLDDATSCVGSMEQSLLGLESDPNDSEALNQICRELHTLKGASASVGLADLADQLHKLEDTLRDDHEAKRAPDVDALLKSVDSVRAQVGGTDVQPEQQPLQASVAEPAANPLPPAASFVDSSDDDEMVRVKSSQLNRLMDMLAQLVML